MADAMPLPPDRKVILGALRSMPDEAFGWIVQACAGVVTQWEGNHGFTPDSTRAFVFLGLAINAYVGGELVDVAMMRAHNPTLFPADPSDADSKK